MRPRRRDKVVKWRNGVVLMEPGPRPGHVVVGIQRWDGKLAGVAFVGMGIALTMRENAVPILEMTPSNYGLGNGSSLVA